MHDMYEKFEDKTHTKHYRTCYDNFDVGMISENN